MAAVEAAAPAFKRVEDLRHFTQMRQGARIVVAIAARLGFGAHPADRAAR